MTLLDFFRDDFLIMIDESHITVPQIRGMYAGDRSRKMTLVDYGFRLPSALDNRPLNFEEFEAVSYTHLYFSDCVTALSGHTREEYEKMTGNNVLDIIYEQDRERVREAHRRCLESYNFHIENSADTLTLCAYPVL